MHKFVLADLELLFCLNKSADAIGKNLFIGLMRYYDFLHDVEQSILVDEERKATKRLQTLVKNMSLAKNKLIFYIAYVRDKFDAIVFREEVRSLIGKVNI